MKKRTAITCFSVLVFLFLLGCFGIYYYFSSIADQNMQVQDASFENDPYAWESTKEFLESRGCKREYVIEWDIPEDNKVKEEKYINDRGESLTLCWYADQTADTLLVTSDPD